MTSLAVHKKRVQEHTEELGDAITLGPVLRPATIGFHTTACACDLLEMYLHIKGLVDVGKVIKHDWFKRPKEGQKILPLIERKMPVSFPGKEQVYEGLYMLEENRDILIYGKPAGGQVTKVLETFQHLRRLLEEKLEEEGIHEE